MQDVINKFLNPDSYSAEVVAGVSQTEIAKLTTSWAIVRLCVEFANNDMRAAEVAVNQLMKQPLLGYERFQLTTARLIIARHNNDKAAFMLALEEWLEGRRETPCNWDNSVLREASFQSWLADIEPDKLKPKTISVQKVSDEDLAFVKDVGAIPLKAVLANLYWLRQMNIKTAPLELAKTYHLTFVNRHLKEATFSAKGDDPSFTVALDEAGNYVNSFLSH
jgi:hypothetical protein